MSREQLSVTELLLSLDSSELQEAEQVRAAVNHQLSTDRGGAVLSSLVDHYLDSSSPQVVLLLSSIREPHHKTLLEKLNESLSRTGSRPAVLTLLGHLIRKQPPWVHHISRSPLLPGLLRCLKTDTDVVVLITGVLVLITLLPMIPQAGKQHIYDFFDVFGRLASWSFKNPGHVPVVHLVHLHAGVYSLFHRLYGMFPCNFISYLRLHYSMKENLDTFQEVVKPMLEHVRVHPELVTGTQDYELDPSRWRCYEVHDIMIECSRVSLDPLESSCEEDAYPVLRDPAPSSPRPPLPHLNLTLETPSSSGSSVCASPSARLFLSPLALNASDTQDEDVTWSPSSQCGLTTPPPEPASSGPAPSGPAPSLSRTASLSGESAGVKCPSASVLVTEEIQDGGPRSDSNNQEKQVTEESRFQPIREQEHGDPSDVINDNSQELRSEPQLPPPSSSCLPLLLTSTPHREESLPPPLCSLSLCLTPPHPSEEGGCAAPPAPPAPPPYEPLFELALPKAALLFIGKKTQEVFQRAGEEEEGGGGGGGGEGEDQISISPLEILDQLIIHGHDAHQHLSRRSSAVSRSLDRSHFGGKQQSMKTKGPAPSGEELQSLRSHLLLLHSQLQYERFKRQQHAIRNRRLLRRVVNATALEEQTVAMRGQLSVQDEEIRSLKTSLEEEQRRYTQLQQDTHTHTETLHTHIQQLLLQQQEEQRDAQRLKTELQESHSELRDLEAELQRANNTASNTQHQLTQLSLKLCSSEQLQQQIYMLNQQLVLMRETNRGLREQLEGGAHTHTEASMLQCSVGKEFQRLKDNDILQRQKLDAANHRISELETQLSRRDQLIQDQKKLLDDTKTQSRCELAACDSRCVALKRLAQTLQTEMLQLYSQIHLDTHTHSHTHSRPQDVRPNGGGGVGGGSGVQKPRPLPSSSVGIINGGFEALSTSPLHLPSCSSSPLSLSPIESPLAVGSFLEQHARQLFGPANQSREGEEALEGEGPQEEQEEEQQEEQQEEQESLPLGLEVEEVSLFTGSPQTEPLNRAFAPHAPPPSPPPPPHSAPPAPPADLTRAVRQRRHELSIMDYDETLPEY